MLTVGFFLPKRGWSQAPSFQAAILPLTPRAFPMKWLSLFYRIVATTGKCEIVGVNVNPGCTERPLNQVMGQFEKVVPKGLKPAFIFGRF
jgi:hypothetical protein